ncbi:hypothetical protein SAY86_006861 [Trapa natans]|uniref:Uncharacterized protein n=1 Tax=Trapa natans TaxID=22666 RepID=A0AAN7LAK4_TRANT|nr:hypothetical protein SAY86_006861 [Trapa natans]
MFQLAPACCLVSAKVSDFCVLSTSDMDSFKASRLSLCWVAFLRIFMVYFSEGKLVSERLQSLHLKTILSSNRINQVTGYLSIMSQDQRMGRTVKNLRFDSAAEKKAAGICHYAIACGVMTNANQMVG